MPPPHPAGDEQQPADPVIAPSQVSEFVDENRSRAFRREMVLQTLRPKPARPPSGPDKRRTDFRQHGQERRPHAQTRREFLDLRNQPGRCRPRLRQPVPGAEQPTELHRGQGDRAAQPHPRSYVAQSLPPDGGVLVLGGSIRRGNRKLGSIGAQTVACPRVSIRRARLPEFQWTPPAPLGSAGLHLPASRPARLRSRGDRPARCVTATAR